MINTLLYTKKLEAVGVAREVAETHVEILSEIVLTNLATKQDLEKGLRELEYKLTIRLTAIMGAMTAFSITTTVALIKLL